MKSCARGGLRGGEDAIEIGLGIAEGDVARDRFVEDVVLLQDHPDVPPHVAVVERFQIGVVEQNRAFGRFEQTGDELDQASFSRSRFGRRRRPFVPARCRG